MIEFCLGVVLGGIFGVMLDQFWSHWKTIPSLELKPSFGFGLLDGSRKRWMTYHVRNVGWSEVPDFEILLWHPRRGYLEVFRSAQNGPLLPEQARDFLCVLLYDCTSFDDGTPDQIITWWLMREHHQPVSEPSFEHFKLIVRMKHSERVLFESEKMGSALAQSWYRLLVGGKGMTGDDIQAISSSPAFRLKHIVERRRRKRELDELLRQPTNADIGPADGVDETDTS